MPLKLPNSFIFQFLDFIQRSTNFDGVASISIRFLFTSIAISQIDISQINISFDFSAFAKDALALDVDHVDITRIGSKKLSNFGRLLFD